jgi:diadenylate cyclase
MDNILFILERATWLSLLDILLVTIVFFTILMSLRETKAVVLLRGVLLLIVLFFALTSFDVLPAFSWLIETAFPAIVLAIPVIFAPEIRRALERLGRASNILPPFNNSVSATQDSIERIVRACQHLSERRHGALIVIQRFDSLGEFAETGIELNAKLTAKLIEQIFYPNSPLHDGAVIVFGNQIITASAIMPLATDDSQLLEGARRLGLRHRAAVGISEHTDAIAVVVSEETGMVSVASAGRIIRKVDIARLRNILNAFFRPTEKNAPLRSLFDRIFRKEIS